MMKFTRLYKLFLLIPASVLGLAAVSNSGGAPPGHTGAPGGAGTCTNCHSGGAVNSGPGTATFAIEGNPTKYEAGKTYNITVTTTEAGTRLFGFQLNVVPSMGMAFGTLQPEGSDLQVTNGFLTHRSNGGQGNGSKEWKFRWTAPETNAGRITFYYAWIGANANGNNSGDRTYNATASLEFQPASAETQLEASRLSLTPNPSAGVFSLNYELSAPAPVEITVVNFSGQIVWSKTTEEIPAGKAQEQLVLNHLAKGVYMAQVKAGTRTYTERLVIE